MTAEYENDQEQLMFKQQGILYVVATPIGNLEDMTPRGIATLQNVDLILAEDTRHSGGLLKKFGITTSMKAYHDHNERKIAEDLIKRIQAGESMALISDAGTPLVSDPGYYLLSLAQQANIQVIPIPGVCALIAGLSASGLASDRFTFNGFLPAKKTARLKTLQTLKQASATQIFYEAPHRLSACISDLKAVFGSNRLACIARELTKIYETIRTESLQELEQWLENDPGQCRGEIVIMVEGFQAEDQEEDGEPERILEILLESLPPSQAVAAAVKITGAKKNQLYKLAQDKTDQD
ncbi:MAG: 16S rRNA (cytidine(1402)-2'-O)-methyltransferase [Gammaproteobacteria bacterium]